MGEYQHSVDIKGRLIVPAKFRERLSDTFVITRGLDNCLFGYPMDEWRKLEEKLKGLPMTKKDTRAFTRFFFSGATEVELDKQGRINIPTALLSYANIDKGMCHYWGSERVLKFGRKKLGKGTFRKLRNPLMKLQKI